MPPELRVELKERGYLSLAGPEEYGGARDPLLALPELLELFAMSHASLRMIVHVANGVWRSVDQFATEEQRARLRDARGDRRPHRRLHADRADRRDRRRPALRGRARGRHLLPLRREAPDHLRRQLRPLAALRPAGGDDRRRRDGRAPGRPRRRRTCRSRTWASRSACRGTDHAHLVFDRAPVPVADRLGEEGKGLQVAFGGFLTPSRIAVAMTCVGLAQRAQELAAEHAAQARHLRQAAVAAPGDLLRAGRERRRHRSRPPARPARGAALGGGLSPTRRCCPRWRS